MGNICNGQYEKEENTETVDTTNKNISVCALNLGKKIKI